MLEKLASFLVNDFHEYQARPYQRLTAAAIQNLFDFADDHAVQVAARNVLDYLAAKYAVSSTNLRRAVSDAQNPQRALVPLPTECGCPLRKPAEVCPREEWNSALVP